MAAPGSVGVTAPWSILRFLFTCRGCAGFMCFIRGFGVMVFNGHYLRLWLLQYGSQEKVLLTFYGLVSVTVRKASPELFLP